MEINYIPAKQGKIAEITGEATFIQNQEDALNLMMNCLYSDADKLILYQENITPNFFNLKTKLAGDILQKFSTYQAYLAIVGDFTVYESKSLQDFIRESNRMKRIHFVSSREEALELFGGLH
ncbi:MAG: DUF4180 domain-containing protein [Sphingobacterium sp.]|jgi:hypothetical protein|uniref:Uncharacterized protein DUF4180 n=1 Tax=Sphingobacterium yanglingense TaxID=1437280 RepID=A0A4R6WIE8_9SPHI|nr:DUF4180 domain-containing protein [Sphingobacterium yanglingense]MDR2283399.1 DUF4180 domain-containing protein [Sphingobacterium sp.]TDQ78167.1 uncharacterized protein DUF4180 [Sphingobacterium yanglingense]